MHYTGLWIGLILVAVSAASAGAAGTPAATEQLIDELGLREAEQPIARDPDWQPRRVVVSLPPSIVRVLPDYEKQLRAAAAETELVFDRSDDLRPDSSQLAGADAIIGYCRPQTMQAADERLLWVHNLGVGMDRCTGLSEAQKDRVVFTNNQRLSAPAIAEHSIAMLLAISRRLPAYGAAQADGERHYYAAHFQCRH